MRIGGVDHDVEGYTVYLDGQEIATIVRWGRARDRYGRSTGRDGWMIETGDESPFYFDDEPFRTMRDAKRHIEDVIERALY